MPPDYLASFVRNLIFIADSPLEFQFKTSIYWVAQLVFSAMSCSSIEAP